MRGSRSLWFHIWAISSITPTASRASASDCLGTLTLLRFTRDAAHRGAAGATPLSPNRSEDCQEMAERGAGWLPTRTIIAALDAHAAAKP